MSDRISHPRHSKFSKRRSRFFAPLVFALLAGLSRLILTETFSRYQVLAFAAVAVVFEIAGRRDDPLRTHASSYLANVAAAGAAIVFVKWHLEGISISHWARLVSEMIV